MRSFSVAAVLVVFAACGSVKNPKQDGGASDGNVDAPGDASVDASVDAPEQTPPMPSRELVGGAKRLSSATFTLDIEVGHAVGQQPASSATHKFEGNAAIKP